MKFLLTALLVLTTSFTIRPLSSTLHAVNVSGQTITYISVSNSSGTYNQAYTNPNFPLDFTLPANGTYTVHARLGVSPVPVAVIVKDPATNIQYGCDAMMSQGQAIFDFSAGGQALTLTVTADVNQCN